MTVNVEKRIQALCLVEHKSVVLVCQFISFINLANWFCVSAMLQALLVNGDTVVNKAGPVLRNLHLLGKRDK